jgi:quercetin dioxygenase-like cupin family protein
MPASRFHFTDLFPKRNSATVLDASDLAILTMKNAMATARSRVLDTMEVTPEGFVSESPESVEWMSISSGWCMRLLTPQDSVIAKLMDNQMDLYLVFARRGCIISPHSHAQTEKIFISKGLIRDIVSGALYDSGKKCVVFIDKNQLHGFHAVEDSLMILKFQPPIPRMKSS